MLPKDFEDRMRLLLGEEAGAFFEELEQPPVKAFRVNRIKTSVEAFEASAPNIQRTKASFPEDGYYTEEPFPGSLPCHHAGMIYMQDPSAMATVCAVRVEEGMKVLDSCSAPGGKTTQLAALVGESGLVVANEYDTKRCRILQSNVERMGCTNTVILNHDTAVLAETYPQKFDLVLADAPCSGEGMFRKNSLAVSEWSLDNVTMCAERQREILANVVQCVAPGGRLIYSTCTFSLEENEKNVDWLLRTYPQLELCEVEEELKRVTADGICFEGCVGDMTLTRRFYPHVSRGEGQFIAVLRNRDATAVEIPRSKKKKGRDERKPSREDAELIALARDFLRENLVGIPPMNLEVINGYAYLMPEIDLPSFGVFGAGVCVGSASGKRLVPHHQLFSALGKRFRRKLLLKQSDPETLAYLQGQEIVADALVAEDGRREGWTAVLIDACPVGGGKVSGSTCKNHYPKGLRNQR